MAIYCSTQRLRSVEHSQQDFALLEDLMVQLHNFISIIIKSLKCTNFWYYLFCNSVFRILKHPLKLPVLAKNEQIPRFS